MARPAVVMAVTLAVVCGLAAIALIAWLSLSLRSAEAAAAAAATAAPAAAAAPAGRSGAGSSQRAGPAWASALRANRTALRALIDDPARLEAHIRELTKTSSLAGSEASMHQVEYVENFWRQLGLKVARRTYEVPLSYFNATTDQPPSVSICRRPGKPAGAAERCEPLEIDKPLGPSGRAIRGVSRAYYGFTRPLHGDFGLLRLSDVLGSLDNDSSRLLTGKLVLLLPNETSYAQVLMRISANLSTGILLAHEPLIPPDSGDSEPAYPNGTGLPDTAVTFHLGHLSDVVGDPTTPGYPSKPYALRREPAPGGWDQRDLNTSALPISQADARRLLEAFDDDVGTADEEVFLRVNWPLRFGYRQVHDSCAELPGWAEPDRAVLIGSHRDAWFGGAIDPHTGVATLLETGRALADLAATTGWRPRRSVLLCAWDAEEAGLMGSVEWVEEEYLRAGARLVAYFNTDTDVMGNWKILVQASDQMVDVIRDVMSELPNPTAGLTKLPPEEPYFFFWPVDDASDYYSFTRALGVPASDLSYIRGPREVLVLYELYHTRYETMRLYRMMDPGGLAHLGLSKSVASIVYTFADSPLLPLNMSALAEGIRKLILGGGGGGGRRRRAIDEEAGDETNEDAPTEAPVSEEVQRLREVLLTALDNASLALRQFDERLGRARAGWTGDLEQRMLNDKMMLVQKAFTHHCVFPCEGSSVNLLNGFNRVTAPLDKVLQAMVLGLSSVPKILTDSFVED